MILVSAIEFGSAALHVSTLPDCLAGQAGQLLGLASLLGNLLPIAIVRGRRDYPSVPSCCLTHESSAPQVAPMEGPAVQHGAPKAD